MNILEYTINKLYQISEINIQENWHYFKGEIEHIDRINPLKWQQVSLNEKKYITFDRGRQICWLAQKITVPSQLQGYPLAGLNLRLCLTWWAEDAKIYIDGKLAQEGDLFDCTTRISLAESVIPDRDFIVAVRLVSPNHDIGALMRSKCLYKSNYPPEAIDPSFVANELTVIKNYLDNFAPQKLDLLEAAIKNIAWDLVGDRSLFHQSLQQLRNTLLPFSNIIKERSFSLLGHAHLDMAWLWETQETWIAAQNTFASVLNLQKDFPQLTFCHSSPALYEWIEANRPDLFVAIQTAVTEEKWELVGGMWIEPEVNIIGGESIVRQLLYGQAYFQAKFNTISRVAWLPDSFGFTWQLPQFFQQAGIEYFATGKLHWNDTTKFPYGCFNWESPDGTRLFTSMLPPCVAGVMDTNPITMTDYGIAWEKQTGLQDIFWIPGVGDHGGGPTRDMLEVGERWQNSPFFPRMRFTLAEEYLQQIKTQLETIPVWKDELYLEFHRGCYTTHAHQKQFNRQCENLLYQAELFTTIASLIVPEGGNIAHSSPIMKAKNKYKKTYQDCQVKIESIWKKVLFNQFHDILPGTSIGEVFIEANRDWQEVIEIGTEILQGALREISDRIDLPKAPIDNAKPLIIFNSLNWQRSELVSVPLSTSHARIYDSEGKQLPTQTKLGLMELTGSTDGETRITPQIATSPQKIAAGKEILFLAENIPSIGYKLFWIVEDKEGKKNIETIESRSLKAALARSNFALENNYIKISIDPETGDIASIFDKLQQQEILKGAGNQLQAFTDRGQYWDAWNIDPNYSEHPLEPTQLKSIAQLDCGELQQSIRVIRTINNSSFTQDYILQQNSPILKIETIVDWQETHVLVKAAFPFNLTANSVNYEIPCGAIARTTKPETDAEQAKWEVPALRWADLTDIDKNYGVSLLNDCKYGYDANPQQLRLTLLRSPRWPDAEADKGIHHFTYAIYPHRDNWKEAKTVRKGYELNLPLQTLMLTKIEEQKERPLAMTGKFIDLGAENLILMAFKPAEIEGFILRCYEAHGEGVELELENSLELKMGDRVDLLERKVNPTTAIAPAALSEIAPWQIVSFKLDTFLSRSGDPNS